MSLDYYAPYQNIGLTDSIKYYCSNLYKGLQVIGDIREDIACIHWSVDQLLVASIWYKKNAYTLYSNPCLDHEKESIARAYWIASGILISDQDDLQEIPETAVTGLDPLLVPFSYFY